MRENIILLLAYNIFLEIKQSNDYFALLQIMSVFSCLYFATDVGVHIPRTLPLQNVELYLAYLY